MTNEDKLREVLVKLLDVAARAEDAFATSLRTQDVDSSNSLADQVVREVREVGYGALMHAASRQWRESLRKQGFEGGEFAVGPCVSVAERIRDDLRTAIAAATALLPAEAFAKPSTKGQSVRIQYSEGETGWAEDLGDGLFRIDNVPYDDTLNIDDVVTVKPRLGRLPIVDKIIKRAFDGKAAIWYDHIEQAKAVRTELRQLGCKTEGVTAPGPTGRGVLIVAVAKGVDPIEIAKKHGIVEPDKNRSSHML